MSVIRTYCYRIKTLHRYQKQIATRAEANLMFAPPLRSKLLRNEVFYEIFASV